MDHIVCLDAEAKELENLIMGSKSMIIRGATIKKTPYNQVNKGDSLYFIKNNGDLEVKARGTVSSVICSDKLSVEESFETIIRNQDKLQLPDNMFSEIAGKSYLVLIGLNDIQEVTPFFIDRSYYSKRDDWIAVEKVELVINRQSQVGLNDKK